MKAIRKVLVSTFTLFFLCVSPVIALAGTWTSNDVGWSYLSNDNSQVTGWQLIGNVWYFFDSNGIMLTGWQNDNGVWYYLDSSGAMMTNTVVDGYPLGSDGVWIVDTTSQNDSSSNFSGTGFWVTPTGAKYHYRGCRTISNSMVEECSIDEAKASGYTACGVCHPPQ